MTKEKYDELMSKSLDELRKRINYHDAESFRHSEEAKLCRRVHAEKRAKERAAQK